MKKERRMVFAAAVMLMSAALFSACGTIDLPCLLGDCPNADKCGNAVVDAEETCDTAIPAGQPGACPTSCTPSNKCHTAKLVNGGTCKAVCQQDVITPCCGNGIVEPPEECDPPTVLSTCFDDCRKGAPCERAGGKCVTDLGSGCGAGQPIDVACLPEGVYPEVPVICCIYIVPFPLQQ